MKFFVPKDIKIYKVPYNSKMKKKEILSIVKIKVGDESFERNLYTYHLGHDQIEIIQFSDLPPKGEIYIPIWSLLRVLSEADTDQTELVIYGLIKFGVIVVFDKGYITDYLHVDNEDDLAKELYNIAKVKRTSSALFTIVTDFETDSLDSKVQKIDELLLTKETVKQIQKSEIIDRSPSLLDTMPQILAVAKGIVIIAFGGAVFTLMVLSYNKIQDIGEDVSRINGVVLKNKKQISFVQTSVSDLAKKSDKLAIQVNQVKGLSSKNQVGVKKLNSDVGTLKAASNVISKNVNELPKKISGSISKILGNSVQKSIVENTQDLADLPAKIAKIEKAIQNINLQEFNASVVSRHPVIGRSEANGTGKSFGSEAKRIAAEIAQLKEQIALFRLKKEMEKERYNLEQLKIKNTISRREMEKNATIFSPSSDVGEVEEFVRSGGEKKSVSRVLRELVNEKKKTKFVEDQDKKTKEVEKAGTIKMSDVSVVGKLPGSVFVRVKDTERKVPVGKEIVSQDYSLIYDGEKVYVQSGSTKFSLEVE